MTGQQRILLKLAVDAARRGIERKQRVGRERNCSGCGGDFDSRTVACRQCTERWLSRRYRGSKTRNACAGCAGHFNELTPGCETCAERFKARGFGRGGDYARGSVYTPLVNVGT